MEDHTFQDVSVWSRVKAHRRFGDCPVLYYDTGDSEKPAAFIYILRIDAIGLS
jgi:hypothetical protein